MAEEEQENPMKDCVLKFDHFENIHRLPADIRAFDGAPNFRKVPGYKVFGTGQPTVEGFKKVLEYIFSTYQDQGLTEVMWTNMRQEPVVYLNGQSYTPRNEDKLNENMEFPNAFPKMIEWYQTALCVAVKGRMGDDKKVPYYKDTYGEHPDDRVNTKEEASLEKEEDFVTLAGMYDQLKEQGFKLKYSRAPIMDEKSPSEKDFDILCKALVAEDRNTGCVFNCQMGKGRTTTGMVIGCLIKDAIKYPKKEFPAEKRPDRSDKVKMAKNGWYQCVRQMLNLFDGEKDKNHLDYILNLCGEPPRGEGLQNLRECINWAKEKYDSEPEEKKEYWLRMARNFVERYMYLICFTHYVREQAWVGFQTCDLTKRFKNFTFQKWMENQAGLRKYIQDAMAKFNWEV
jgi:hypothetical protein